MYPMASSAYNCIRVQTQCLVEEDFYKPTMFDSLLSMYKGAHGDPPRTIRLSDLLQPGAESDAELASKLVSSI